MTRLSTRLSLGLAISLALILTAQWFAMRHVFSDIATQQLVKKLVRDGEHLLANLRLDAHGALQLDETQLQAMYQRPFSGAYFVIQTGTQNFASRSLWDVTLVIKPLDNQILNAGDMLSMMTAGPQNQRLLTVAHGYRKYQQTITIIVAEDVTALDASLRQFERWYGAISAVILALLLLLQSVIVKLSLRPLKLVEQNVAEIATGKKTTITAVGPAEITPLILEFNRLLSVMQRQSQRSKEAFGNLAHALKTQLAVINQALNNEMASHDAAHKTQSHSNNTAKLNAFLQTLTSLMLTVKNATQAMDNIVTRELKKVRLQRQAVAGKRISLSDTVKPLIETLQFIHQDKSLHIHCDISAKHLMLEDPEAFSELLGNVLDNACKWCSQQVYLAIKVVNRQYSTSPNNELHTLVITVADDGLGCDASALNDLKLRGFRLDESTPGSGLGLAIAQDIVDNFGGTLSFSSAEAHGGLEVCITLPQSFT
jgi:signal transduction histidine kinase